MVLSKKYFESGDLVSSEKYFSQARRLFPDLRRPNWLSNQYSEPINGLTPQKMLSKQNALDDSPRETADDQPNSGFSWNFVLLVFLIVVLLVFRQQLKSLYNVLRQKTAILGER